MLYYGQGSGSGSDGMRVHKKVDIHVDFKSVLMEQKKFPEQSVMTAVQYHTQCLSMRGY